MNIIFCVLLLICTAELAESEVISHESFESSETDRRKMFINLGGGGDDCARWDTWTLSASGSLNDMAEASTAHTFGIKVDGTTNGSTPCDILVGVFTYGGSFGCVIEGGVANNQIKYCDSYPDTPVYAFNHNVRRWGTFVALEESCTNMLHVNRFYMKNSQQGEKYWTYNQWVGEEVDGERLLSEFQVDSIQDSGYFLSENWAYVPPVYEWYTESFPSCSNGCNYEGGVVTRHVVCRATKPKVSGQATDGNHNYISWDGSKCAGLTKPDTYQMCPAGSCHWVDYATNWNCMGAGQSAANLITTGVATAAQCQANCFEYSYAGWWNHDSKLKCKCFHVCHEGGATSGGVYTNLVYEQVATGRRKH